MIIKCFLALLMLFFFINVYSIQAADIFVNKDIDDKLECNSQRKRCSTIQKALDLAAEKDTIKIDSGFYYVHNDIKNKNRPNEKQPLTIKTDVTIQADKINDKPHIKFQTTSQNNLFFIKAGVKEVIFRNLELSGTSFDESGNNFFDQEDTKDLKITIQGVDKVFSIIQCPDSYEVKKPDNPDDKPLEELDYRCVYMPQPSKQGWYIPIISFFLVLTLFIIVATFVFISLRSQNCCSKSQKKKETEHEQLILSDSDEMDNFEDEEDIMDM